MQPAEGIFFIHHAICRDAQAIEALALAAESSASLEALAARLTFFARVVKLHTDGEEAGLYPDIEARAPHVGAPYLMDHVAEIALHGELLATIAAAAKAQGGARADLLAKVRRHAIALTEHTIAHVRKENELIVPLLVKLFTPPEQGAQVGRMLAKFPPADMQRVLPWIVNLLTNDERLTYLSLMQRLTPPDRLPGVVAWIRAGVSDEVWRGITTGVPGLA